jgi:hypothetical protein
MAYVAPTIRSVGDAVTAADYNIMANDVIDLYDRSIISFKQAIKTDTFSASISSGANTAITGLSITHTMTKATNRIVLIGYVTGSQSDEFRLALGVAYDGSLSSVFIGDAASSRTRLSSMNRSQDSVSLTTTNVSGIISPGDTSSHSYALHAINTRASLTRTTYINRGVLDLNDVECGRGMSNLMLLEVGAA